MHVLDAQALRLAAASRTRVRSYRSATEALAPRGDMTLSGVVMRVVGDRLILRTRSNERKTIVLRPDTRYLGGGQSMDRSNVEVNTRVFIRAGHNLDNDVEAYQVIWGDILQP